MMVHTCDLLSITFLKTRVYQESLANKVPCDLIIPLHRALRGPFVLAWSRKVRQKIETRSRSFDAGQDWPETRLEYGFLLRVPP
jgi:hypothetical protein